MRPPSTGSRDAIEVKISNDMPLPMPRSVISSPSHMITAVPAVIVTTSVAIGKRLVFGMIWSEVEQPLEQPARPGQRDDAGRLQDRQRDGQVPGVLGELRLAGRALLLQGLQPRDHHDQQLNDDAAGDVRHDAEREDRQLEQRATAEQVHQRVDVAVLGAPVRQVWTAERRDARRRQGAAELGTAR